MDTSVYDTYLALVQRPAPGSSYVDHVVTRAEDPAIPQGYEKRPVVWPTTGERFMGLYPVSGAPLP